MIKHLKTEKETDLAAEKKFPSVKGDNHKYLFVTAEYRIVLHVASGKFHIFFKAEFSIRDCEQPTQLP